jgi:hypothetical protein
MSALAIFLIGVAFYIAIRIAGLVFSQPARIKLASIVDDMIDGGQVKSSDAIRHLSWLVDSSMSSRVGLLVPVVAFALLARQILAGGNAADAPVFPELRGNASYDRAMLLHMTSIAASNPFAFLLAVPAMLGLVALSVRRKRSTIRAFESPVISAASQLQPC